MKVSYVPCYFFSSASSLGWRCILGLERLVELHLLLRPHSCARQRNSDVFLRPTLCGSQGAFGSHPRASYVDMDLTVGIQDTADCCWEHRQHSLFSALALRTNTATMILIFDSCKWFICVSAGVIISLRRYSDAGPGLGYMPGPEPGIFCFTLQTVVHHLLSTYCCAEKHARPMYDLDCTSIQHSVGLKILLICTR